MSKTVHVLISLGLHSLHQVASVLFQHLPLHFFPLSFSSSFSVPLPTLHLSSLLQTSVSLSEYNTQYFFFSFHFLQALINPAWPPTPRSCTVGFGNVHLELFQLPWGPSALHKATQGLHAECLGVSLAFPRMKWHHSICWLCVFLAPSPLVSLLIQKERQKKWAAAVLCMKAIVGSSPPSLWSEVNITLFFLVAVDTFRKVRYKVQVEYSWGFSCIHSGWLSGIRSVNDNRKPFYIRFLLTCS